MPLKFKNQWHFNFARVLQIQIYIGIYQIII